MRLVKRLALAILILSGTPSAAFAAGTTGTGASPYVLLECVYNASLPVLTTGQTAAVQCDPSGRLVSAPATLVQGSPLQMVGASGIGPDTAFPGTVSNTGTSLGSLPTGASRLQIHIPPGAAISLYVASVVAANSTAAALVSTTYSNAAGTTNMDANFDLNGQQVWVTHYVTGTASTYISGIPVYRFL